MLRIENLVKEFHQPSGEKIRVLTVGEFCAQKGEQWIIAGPSGSGKTTLLHLVAGLYGPTEGSLYWGEQRLDQMPPQERDLWRAQNVGYIFQSFNLLPSLTVLENIKLAAAWADGKFTLGRLKAADLLLSAVGLTEKADYKPARLSVGEQQRVAVARALINKPALILADEPTASLDQENGKKVIALIKALCEEQGSSLLLATHDPAVMTQFSLTYDVRQGEVGL